MAFEDELYPGASNVKSAGYGTPKPGQSAGIAQGIPLNDKDWGINAKIRTFQTGATRDQDQNKLDYEGFLCPIVLERFALYMHEHRKQSDGSLRASDNWQKGMPRTEYVKSMFRHFMEVWRAIRNPYQDFARRQTQDALCAIMFNAMGLLHEIMIGRNV